MSKRRLPALFIVFYSTIRLDNDITLSEPRGRGHTLPLRFVSHPPLRRRHCVVRANRVQKLLACPHFSSSFTRQYALITTLHCPSQESGRQEGRRHTLPLRFVSHPPLRRRYCIARAKRVLPKNKRKHPPSSHLTSSQLIVGRTMCWHVFL